MLKNNRAPELILPAGSLEKLQYAFAYGADAVYAGPPDSSLRANMNDFNLEDLKKAIAYTHGIGKRIYITLNLFAHEEDLERVKRYAEELSTEKPDAFIVSDPGVFNILVNEIKTDIPIHLSTQMNTTNSESIKFWQKLGVKRIILARELNFKELELIVHKIDSEIELEIFIHGAMCVSYSGRCLLSNFFSGRDSNRGECNQPCRWKYYLIEEKRPGQEFEIIEEQRGTYILNSKDLCLIDKLKELSGLNINGYKIEGRTKNIFYLSLTTLAYRKAIDILYDKAENQNEIDYIRLINLPDNHGFTHGFLFDDKSIMQNINDRNYKKQNLLGYVVDVNEKGLQVKIKNPVSNGEKVLGINPEFVTPLTIKEMTDLNGNMVNRAYGAKGDEVIIKFDKRLDGESWRYGIISRIPL